MRVKICGITKPEQGEAIAQLGATALGFICVPSSPRYVTPDRIQAIVSCLPRPGMRGAIDCVGVFVDASLDEMRQGVEMGLTAIQLHGQETLQFCHQIRAAFPDVELIKALRIRDAVGLQQACEYQAVVDTLLLDAYHPQLLGGTGKTLNWGGLQEFRPGCPWFLAGGLTPENIRSALSLVRPDGIDLSSGVELAPGDKDLHRVKHLFEQLQGWGDRGREALR